MKAPTPFKSNQDKMTKLKFEIIQLQNKINKTTLGLLQLQSKHH